MILIFCFIAALSGYNTSAAPAPFLIIREAAVNAESDSNQLNRTLFGIIWSCLSTTTLCAWTAVHPNVPPRNKWIASWNRVKLMFWMIIAPELVLAWAVRQYYAAREIRDEYNRSRPNLPAWMKWTLVHGHMVEMGGFTLVNPEDEDKSPNEMQARSKVLIFDDLKRLLKHPTFKFPSIRVADIEDRAKGDTLFKLLTMLQTTRFMVQCIARGLQGLAITELELVTLALASLNAVTFVIWWHKPLGIQEPIRICLRLEQPKADKKFQQHQNRSCLSYNYVISNGSREVKRLANFIVDFLLDPCETDPIEALLFLFFVIVASFSFIVSLPLFVFFPLGIITLLKIIETERVPEQANQQRGLLAANLVKSLQQFRDSSSSAVTKFVENWLKELFGELDDLHPFLFGWFIVFPLLFILLLIFVILFTPFLALLSLISFLFTAVFGIVTTSTIHPGASHVPSFYAPTTKSDRWSRMVVFALFGLIFGGLHCIGWTFEFPSHSEKALWRATSLIIMVIPPIVAPIDFFLTARLHDHDIKSCQFKTFERRIVLLLDFVMTILLFIYVPTRLSLIAQALALLRHQPSTALVAVDWTMYLPHLFS